jgi:hypothetical protein
VILVLNLFSNGLARREWAIGSTCARQRRHQSPPNDVTAHRATGSSLDDDGMLRHDLNRAVIRDVHDAARHGLPIR